MNRSEPWPLAQSPAEPSDAFAEPGSYAVLISDGTGGSDGVELRAVPDTTRAKARARALAYARRYPPRALARPKGRTIYANGPDSFIVEVRLPLGAHVFQITVIEQIESSVED